jgi:hypothetical protein
LSVLPKQTSAQRPDNLSHGSHCIIRPQLPRSLARGYRWLSFRNRLPTCCLCLGSDFSSLILLQQIRKEPTQRLCLGHMFLSKTSQRRGRRHPHALIVFEISVPVEQGEIAAGWSLLALQQSHGAGGGQDLFEHVECVGGREKVAGRGREMILPSTGCPSIAWYDGRGKATRLTFYIADPATSPNRKGEVTPSDVTKEEERKRRLCFSSRLCTRV